jgi:hypothetical protein
VRLWLISGDPPGQWDVYDSAVVAAETACKARHTHPGGGRCVASNLGSWVAPADVAVVLIGEAAPGTVAGVVCASYNAG